MLTQYRKHRETRFLLAALFVAGLAGGAQARPSFTDDGPRPLIQLALLLDTSNSMDGLIGQAKSRLWRVVNELSACERNGSHPVVQVAIYEYGNNSLAAGENYLRQVLPFTADLDQVSEKLFALTTNGGEEYCGAVIRDASRALPWSARPDVYKAMFVAGNEPFTQGPVDYRAAVGEAAGRGIFVNTIFCGTRQEGVATQWFAGAQAGQGDYHVINQDEHYVAVRAPQDDEIARLGIELNATFIPYGASGRAAASRQAMQDSMAGQGAAAMAAAPVERSVFKASKQYAEEASSWDIVGGITDRGVRADDLKREELPQAMRGMSAAEIDKLARETMSRRQRIQEKIARLQTERKSYLAEKEKSEGKKGLDQAMVEAVRSQAARKSFKFGG